jgi:hypothetical protein
MTTPYYDYRCKHHDLIYECKKGCKKKQKDCKHEKTSCRWHYSNDTLVKAGGLCYECGKELRLNKERTKLV